MSLELLRGNIHSANGQDIVDVIANAISPYIREQSARVEREGIPDDFRIFATNPISVRLVSGTAMAMAAYLLGVDDVQGMSSTVIHVIERVYGGSIGVEVGRGFVAQMRHRCGNPREMRRWQEESVEAANSCIPFQLGVSNSLRDQLKAVMDYVLSSEKPEFDELWVSRDGVPVDPQDTLFQESFRILFRYFEHTQSKFVDAGYEEGYHEFFSCEATLGFIVGFVQGIAFCRGLSPETFLGAVFLVVGNLPQDRHNVVRALDLTKELLFSTPGGYTSIEAVHKGIDTAAQYSRADRYRIAIREIIADTASQYFMGFSPESISVDISAQLSQDIASHLSPFVEEQKRKLREISEIMRIPIAFEHFATNAEIVTLLGSLVVRVLCRNGHAPNAQFKQVVAKTMTLLFGQSLGSNVLPLVLSRFAAIGNEEAMGRWLELSSDFFGFYFENDTKCAHNLDEKFQRIRHEVLMKCYGEALDVEMKEKRRAQRSAIDFCVRALADLFEEERQRFHQSGSSDKFSKFCTDKETVEIVMYFVFRIGHKTEPLSRDPFSILPGVMDRLFDKATASKAMEIVDRKLSKVKISEVGRKGVRFADLCLSGAPYKDEMSKHLRSIADRVRSMKSMFW